ncbi:hypothetical protein EMN47_08380 [Prolixibacteraceae bacterium JC049]|nr:hypothetical protein [Prolixibacteraceae bacterium JC049]
MEPTSRKKIPAKKKTWNRLGIGLFLGLLLPWVILLITYTQAANNQSFVSFLEGMWHMRALIKLLSLCTIINVGVFMLFIKTNRLTSARGVLMATFIYAFVVVFYRMMI